ncbi:periplasmic heavy metal sensor [Sphingomonas sp. CL5.1]|uniref:periplasmic heavy metal sensor n=1 Tax=Sphingomonas sp. CL5.1 TaxID=2653203 RepID=UPI001583282E|nr:periplasmic heavy metal sensor [Sphingomonas sp. CL5.1]QKR99648.1 periplasmic heavy metal sensor [Sphingomonas sp. CL5.1]
MMLGMIIAVALQAAAPAAPAGAQATPEQRTRLALAARGMSQAGIDAMIAAEKKHTATLRGIAERGQAAEQNLRAALAKRPVDVEAFVAANTARGEASSALQREAVMVANEQMRALSPADRVVLSQIAASPSQPPRQPAKPQPKR